MGTKNEVLGVARSLWAVSKVHIEQEGVGKNCLVHYLFIFNEWEREKCNEMIQVRYKEKLFNCERSEAGEQVIQESHCTSSLRDLERWAYQHLTRAFWIFMTLF